MEEHTSSLYVGVDWATETHQVAVLNPQRRVISERKVTHSGAALAEFIEGVRCLASGDLARVAVAIEVPHGALVDTLLEHGCHVFALNPKQLDRFRDRYALAGAKDDRRDARVLAEALCTDRRAFRRLEPAHPLILQLRERLRVEEDLEQEFRRLSNRLREQLYRMSPPLLSLCPAADEPWLWALMEQAPTPAQGRRLARARVEQLLRAHRIRRLTAAAVLEQLRAPALRMAPGTVEAASEHMALLLLRLRLVHEQRRSVAKRVEALLSQLEAEEGGAGPRGEQHAVRLLRSMPGVGRVVTATLLAEAGQPLALRDYHALRSQGGLAPITRQSGKRIVVRMRYGCNQRLRNALYHWARESVQRDAHSRHHYDRLRQRGHGHARALRGVADRLLAVLIAMLKAGTPYDPARRQTCAVAA